MMKIKIVADGDVFGTKVYSPDGADITDTVHAVRFSHEAGEIPRAYVEFELVQFDGKAGAMALLRTIKDGVCISREVRLIEFADGERLTF